MKNKFKLSVLIIAFIVFLSACGNDTDKFLQGTWKSDKGDKRTITFDKDKMTHEVNGFKYTVKYKIQDVAEDIIYIEADVSDNKNKKQIFRFQKEKDTLLFIDNWGEENGEEVEVTYIDMEYEKLEKVSGNSGIPNWVYIIGFIILVGIYMGWKNTD
ncbi:hypothetical protein K2V59_04455 [Staphylococcus arlettae]|uniref:hypothetical protein n=1 Tax=Staphylococcus arlettae TaxID=29378 RepID=UPI001E28406A|nr:hypothetical protein [Staphylococcus arlettae]MCD8888782.1 hypothetical protein [Staphylococcus arlettae]